MHPLAMRHLHSLEVTRALSTDLDPVQRAEVDLHVGKGLVDLAAPAGHRAEPHLVRLVVGPLGGGVNRGRWGREGGGGSGDWVYAGG